MEFNKRILIFILLFICILSISTVSAVDLDGGKFDDLNNTISSNNNINLTGNIQKTADEWNVYYKGININKTVVIDGNGHTISASFNGRLFYVNSTGDLTLKNLIISNGKTFIVGGAIFVNKGKLTLINVTFINNEAFGNGGAIYNNGSFNCINSNFKSSYASMYGGAIYNNGSFHCTNSSFESNHAFAEGGAVFIRSGLNVTFANNNFIDNCAVDGGAILIHLAKVSIFGSYFMNNKVKGCGGAICNLLGTLYVSNSAFINNSASNVGSAVMDMSMGTFNYNIFVGNDLTNGLAVSSDGIFSCNYFGTNGDPVNEGIINGTIPVNNIKLNVTGDFNNLSIGKTYCYNISYAGNGCDKLLLFSAFLSSKPKKLIFKENFITISSNTSKFNFIPFKSGNTTLFLDFNYYTPIKIVNITNAYITLKNVTMSLDVKNIDYGDDLNVKIYLSDDEGSVIAGTANLLINNVSYDIFVNDGVGSLSISGLTPGKYLIQANYFTEDFQDLYQNKSIFVFKANPLMNIIVNDVNEGQNAIINIELPKDATGAVTINVNGYGGMFTLINGSTQLIINGLPENVYIVSVYYSGDNNYNQLVSSTVFFVNKVVNSSAGSGNGSVVGPSGPSGGNGSVVGPSGPSGGNGSVVGPSGPSGGNGSVVGSSGSGSGNGSVVGSSGSGSGNGSVVNSSSNSTNQTITNTPSDPVLPANQDIIDNINVIMEDTISNIKKGKGVGEDSTQSENSRTLSSSNSVGSNSNSPSKENAYEVNKRISKSLIRDSFIYEIIAALLLIILFIIGFMRYKPNI